MVTRNDLTASPLAAKWLHPSRWLTFMVLFVSLVVTWQLWRNEQHNAAQALRSEFDFHARETNNHIVERMQAYEQVLRGVAGLLSHAKGVSRQEFHNYFDRLHLDENYPGIQGLAFLRVVRQAQLDQHIAAVRRGGIRNTPSSRRGNAKSIRRSFISSHFPA